MGYRVVALSVGGIGLRGAVRSRPAAHWSSWADSLEMIQQRHEPVCAQILHLLTRGRGSFHVEGAVRARQDLQRMVFDAPEVPLAQGKSKDKPKEGTTDTSNVKCFFSKEKGHTRKDCPKFLA